MNTSLISKTAWNSGGSLCLLLGRLIVQILIARLLGPEGVGKIVYMVWLIELVNLLIFLGLPNMLTRYLAELHGQKKTDDAVIFAQWVYIRYLILAILGALVIGVLFLYSSVYEGLESALPILQILFILRGLEFINRANLSGKQRFDQLAYINLIETIILVIGVALGSYWYGIIGALYGYIAGAFVPAVYSFSILKGNSFTNKIETTLQKRAWKFAVNTWLAMIASAFVWSRMEFFFLERYWSASEIAMFSIAISFSIMISQVANMFSGAFTAHFSHLSGMGEQTLIERQYLTATKLLGFFIVPIAFGSAALMPVLIPMLFGSEFASAIPNAMVLTAASALLFSIVGSSLVYAKEKAGFIAISGCSGAIISIILGFLIISRFGVWGAVFSRLFVQSLMMAIGTWFIIRRLRFAFPFQSFGRAALSGSLCAIFIWFIIHILPHPMIGLAFAIPSGTLVYLISAKFFHVLSSEELFQISRITGYLPQKLTKCIFQYLL